MGKNLIAFVLSVAIGLQPIVFYSTPTFAQTEKSEQDHLLELLKQISSAKWNFMRNKIYGQTPGANPQMVPSNRDIESYERQLLAEKNRFFTNLTKNLENPFLQPNRKTDATPVEFLWVGLFYKAAAELEALKMLNGEFPQPQTWREKYAFRLATGNIANAYMYFAIGELVERTKNGPSATFTVQLKSQDLQNSYFEFNLNPLFAAELVEKQMALQADNESMLRIAQYTAADLLYDSSAMIHILNRHSLSGLPEVPAQLQDKFPLLKWKRQNYILSTSSKDKFAMIEPLAYKKIGALVEKLNKERRLFFDVETALKIFQIKNPGEPIKITDEGVQEAYNNLVSIEQEINFIPLLKSILISTDYNPEQSKEFWSQHIKLAITQAKLASATDTVLNSEADTETIRQAMKTVLLERAETYLSTTLQNLDVPLIIKHVKDENTYLKEKRTEFQKKLWLSAKRIESSLVVENDPIDLTVIADNQFIAHLNATINKPTTAAPIKDKKAKAPAVAPIRPNTVQWLQTIFQPQATYGVIRENYKKAIFDAFKDFRAVENSTETPLDEKPKTIAEVKEWLKKSQYNINSVRLHQDADNFLALNLQQRAPEARKQELLELIRIGENLGFFQGQALGETPLVNQMHWSTDWMQAYHAVIVRRTFAQNPLLVMKMSDGEHESNWASIVSTTKWAVDWIRDITQPQEKSLWQELAPLYANEQEVTDESADQVVSKYLLRMQEIINLNLTYVSAQGAAKKADWYNPLSWSLLIKEEPTMEFSTEFKQIIARSQILTATLLEHGQFQNLFMKMREKLDHSSAETKAYDMLYNNYVSTGFLFVIGLSVLSFATKYTYKRFHSIINLFQNEALVPIFGANLRYYQWSALTWFGVHTAANGVDIFGSQRDLRNRTSDLAFTSATSTGLIDLKTKEIAEGIYNKARLDWAIEVGTMAAVMAAFLSGYPLARMVTRHRETKAFKAWIEKTKKLVDDAGFQKRPDGETHIGLLQGDVTMMKIASEEQIASRVAMAKGQTVPKYEYMSPKAKENFKAPEWVETEYFTAEINAAREQLAQEVDAAMVGWAKFGARYETQFRSLRMEPGQWDYVLFNRRAIELKEALASKKISREQYWILSQNLQDLIKAFRPYYIMMRDTPVLGHAVIERIATSASKLKFDSNGHIISLDVNHIPQVWRESMQSLTGTPKEVINGFLDIREFSIGIQWKINPATKALEPTRRTFYAVGAREAQALAYEKQVKAAMEGLK